MSIDCRNVLVGEILLGAGYLIGTSSSQPKVVAISVPSQIQEVAADMAGRSGPMGPWFLIGCAVLLLGLWAAGRGKAKDQVSFAGETAGADVPTQTTWTQQVSTWATAVRKTGVQREIQKNPFGSDYAYLRFEDRVQMAARQSLENNCIMGVVCLSLHPSIIDWAGAKRELRSHIEGLADELKKTLQKTDGVQVTDANEIVVFATRLRSRDDLLETARHLSSFLAEKSENLRFAAPGFALYPLHGYTSTELIESARKNFVFVETSIRHTSGLPSARPAPELCS